MMFALGVVVGLLLATLVIILTKGNETVVKQFIGKVERTAQPKGAFIETPDTEAKQTIEELEKRGRDIKVGDVLK